MLIRYPELQSGFVAYPSERGIKRPDPVPTSPVSVVLQPKMTRTQQEYFFSQEVDSLVKEITVSPLTVRDLAFQAKVFQLAGVLFDKKGIFAWMRIQEEGKHISLYHKKFLEDTLGAVLMGRGRLHEPSVWAPMISAANDPLLKPFKASEVTTAIGCRPPDDLSEFLGNWVNTLGIIDLLLSLQVIFGRRTLHASFGGLH